MHHNPSLLFSVPITYLSNGPAARFPERSWLISVSITPCAYLRWSSLYKGRKAVAKSILIFLLVSSSWRCRVFNPSSLTFLYTAWRTWNCSTVPAHSESSPESQ
ncbi:conserved hypothetical protein, partial [Trichinella spiralis]